jgi:hypothetical protein
LRQLRLLLGPLCDDGLPLLDLLVLLPLFVDLHALPHLHQAHLVEQPQPRGRSRVEHLDLDLVDVLRAELPDPVHLVRLLDLVLRELPLPGLLQLLLLRLAQGLPVPEHLGLRFPGRLLLHLSDLLHQLLVHEQVGLLLDLELRAGAGAGECERASETSAKKN